MQSTNYISTLPNELITKNVSNYSLTSSIKFLRENYIHEDRTKVKWKKEYLNQETFIKGKSSINGEYHLILPKYKYTFNLRVEDELPKYIVKSIAYNSLILAQINDRENEYMNQECFAVYYILLFTRKYAYQTYKNNIVSNVKLWYLLSEVIEYIYTKFNEEEYQIQIEKNSNTICTVGKNLSSNQKKSISVKKYRELFDKERDSKEISFIMELYMKSISSRDIAKEFKKQFKKQISYRTVQRIENKYAGFYTDNIGIEDLIV
jgi:hypothetical protein